MRLALSTVCQRPRLIRAPTSANDRNRLTGRNRVLSGTDAIERRPLSRKHATNVVVSSAPID